MNLAYPERWRALPRFKIRWPVTSLRVVFICSVMLMVSALSNVYVQYQARHAFSAWRGSIADTESLQRVHRQLLLERAALRAPGELWRQADQRHFHAMAFARRKHSGRKR